MAGKCRPSLRSKTLRNVMYSSLSTTDKTCIKAMFERMELLEKAEPVKHGRWIPIQYDGYADGYPVCDLWECSECQDEHSGDEDTLTPYCPNCGAKMDLEVDNAPTIEAEPVKHGKWLPYMEEMDNGFGETYLVQTGLQCSECGAYGCCGGNFCKNCGAKMDLEE